MKFFYCASEVHPFVKTGGLADVMAALPKAIKKSYDKIYVVLPLYGHIEERFRREMEYIGYDYVKMHADRIYMGVFHLREAGVDYYFIDNESFFRRTALYGYEDDGYRFAFFSKACASLIRYLEIEPDIVHANDWHTGLVPLYIKDFAAGDARYRKIRTIFTIHNINYQGYFGADVFRYTDLHSRYFTEEGVRFYDGINMMKAGIQFADGVTTVSETYARELRDPFYGKELAGLIEYQKEKVYGIQNGIDTDEYDPEHDPLLAANYGPDSLDKKIENKRDVQKRYGLPERDVPLFTVISRLDPLKGMDLILEILDKFLDEDVQFLVLGTGEERIQWSFRSICERRENASANIFFDNDESHRIYAAGDFFLVPSVTEPSGLSQMVAMTYGNIPIVRATGGLKDTVVPFDEAGRGGGYVFYDIDAHALLAAMQKAKDEYYAPIDRIHRQSAMRQGFGWQRAANAYRELYKEIRRKTR
ncbi:starch synthase [Peptoniphilus ivorii]|uniref:glycogen synthase n=1 Tax=Aedoeadaptatus ivorii TaxID=54006 RepID=UPI002780EF9B|nr:glycogen synthase [Peptoniphilus ivorii]MDQ0508575.1 starch synthase [Peptoniphilus ivorii]